MSVLSNIEACREPRQTGSRRSIIKFGLGLGYVAIGKTKTWNN